ncbi:protein PDF [Drosophila nasuta]|uniref:Protein PDF n=1 Tax=Drosophila albomicans TaxID=7291 RepID=A0A6P8XQL5_DROAB|nr:protein PDF [Drosophila albomicans]XP_060648343.1 protein PDF [Drosophila nasuta]
MVSFASFKCFAAVRCSRESLLTMANYNLILALLVLISCSLVVATPDEERYMEKEYNRDLFDWINNAARYAPLQAAGNPCKYYPYYLANALPNNNMRMPKRNSELINSLLSLPKNMNDAGK